MIATLLLAGILGLMLASVVILGPALTLGLIGLTILLGSIGSARN